LPDWQADQRICAAQGAGLSMKGRPLVFYGQAECACRSENRIPYERLISLSVKPMPAARPLRPTVFRLLAACLLLLAGLGILPASGADETPDLRGDPVTRFRASLTRNETVWLGEHPVLRVGNGPDFQPFYAWRGDKRYTGPSADYLALLSRRTGLHFELQRFADFPAVITALKQGRIDIIPTLTPTEARRREFLFTGGYLHSPAIVVTRSGGDTLALPSNFDGVRIAIERGHASREILRRSKPAATFMDFPDTEAALRAVSNGEADAYVGMLAVAHYYMEQLALANLQVRQRFDADLSAMAMAVDRDQPILHDILRKAMLVVSNDETNALTRHYLPPGTGIPGESFRLTAAEQAWLRSHGPVRMGYDQAFYPLSYTNRSHQAEGYSIELFHLLRDKTGLAVNETAGPWTTVLKKTIENDLDVLVAVANTTERRDKLLFVGPYMSTPTVIVTRSDFQQVWDLAEFAGRKLALIEDHFLIQRIRSAYPSIQLIEVPGQEDALRLVAAGSADVAIGNLHAVNRLIQSTFLGKLYIAGHVPDGDSELYLGVSKQAPELATILRRALDAVSPAEISAAKNHWLDTRYAPGQSISRVTAFAGPLMAMLLTALIVSAVWNRHLKKELAASRSDLHGSLQELEACTSRLQATLTATDLDGAGRALNEMRQHLDALKGAPTEQPPRPA
jgi:two-component system, NarL family, sensor histidine kinase EvgS